MPLCTFSLVFFSTCTHVRSISNPPHCFLRPSISPSKSNTKYSFSIMPHFMSLFHSLFRYTSSSAYFYPPSLSRLSRSLSILFSFSFVQSLGFCMNVASPLSFYSHLIIYIPLPSIHLDLQRHLLLGSIRPHLLSSRVKVFKVSCIESIITLCV